VFDKRLDAAAPAETPPTPEREDYLPQSGRPMKRSLTRNIIQTFSTQVAAQLISVLAGIVVARTIGPAGKGFISYAMTVVGLVTVFFYGFGDAVMVQFGKKGLSARAVHSAALRVLTAVMSVVIPVLVIIAICAPSQRPLAAAAAALPFAIYIQLMTPFLMVREKIGLVNSRAILQNFGTAALTVPLLLFAHLGLPAVVGSWVLFYVVAGAQTVWGLRPILASSPPAADSSTDVLAEQIRFGTRAAGASAAGFLNLRIDVFVVSIMFSAAALGWYTLAIASGELMWQVSRAFVWSAVGRIGSSSQAESAELVARLTRNTLAIVGSLGIVAFLAGPWLIVHVYGQSFAPAGAALRWALPGLIAYAAEVALTSFIVLQLGRPLMMVWVQSASAATCAALTFAMAGRFGIVGAAASTSLTYLVVTGVLISLFVRATGIPLRRLVIIQREDLRHYSGVLNGMLRTFRLRSA
jgi:O-antigen/teichoic acid export membrane protein